MICPLIASKVETRVCYHIMASFVRMPKVQCAHTCMKYLQEDKRKK